MFHDAGKFHGGELHGDDVPEEQHSVEVLRKIDADLSAWLKAPPVVEVASPTTAVPPVAATVPMTAAGLPRVAVDEA